MGRPSDRAVAEMILSLVVRWPPDSTDVSRVIPCAPASPATKGYAPANPSAGRQRRPRPLALGHR